MKRSIKDYFGNGKAEGSDAKKGEERPSETISLSESAALKKASTEEEAKLILNAKWPNTIFKFYDICNYVPRFEDVMRLRFTSGGVDIDGVDRAHIAKINIHLDRSDFLKYELKQEERLFSINFKELTKKMKRFTKHEEEITITITLDLMNLIRFECRGIHFCQKPAETELDAIPNPQLEFQIAYTANLSDLIEVLDFACDHTDYVFLDTNNGFRVKGSCTEDETPFDKTIKVKNLRNGPPANNLYRLGHLLDILKITHTKYLDRQGVLLELTHGMPLRITLPISNASYFEAYLAPRVETDEAHGTEQEPAEKAREGRDKREGGAMEMESEADEEMD